MTAKIVWIRTKWEVWYGSVCSYFIRPELAEVLCTTLGADCETGAVSLPKSAAMRRGKTLRCSHLRGIGMVVILHTGCHA